jgi:hypothetical protein
MVLQLAKKLVRHLTPFRHAENEAAENYLGKTSKVAIVNDLIMAGDLRELSEADRQGVAALKEKHGFGKKKRGGFMGLFGGSDGDKNIMAADDVSLHGSNFAEMLLCLAIGAGACWFICDKMKPAHAEASASADADLHFYQRRADGTVVPIDIPRLPAELRK